MVRQLWPASRKWQVLIILGAIVVLFAAMAAYTGRDRLPKLHTMNIGTPPAHYLPVIQGNEWNPAEVDADGFATVAENERFTLLLDPATSQIAVRNKQSGFLWRSNPTQEALANEKVRATLLQNIQSPFIMEYVKGIVPNRLVTNAMNPKLTMKYTRIETKGVQVTYSFTELQITFVIQYVLTEHGLEATIPSQGIVEEGDIKVYAINLLPFFGAVSEQEEQGYLFVPDGPGGLIYFDRIRPNPKSNYEYAIYGNDPANLKLRNQQTPREQISYPVYGLKRGDHAFVAIIDEGKYTASIKAVLPGNISTYNTVSVNFQYREEYGRRLSAITEGVVNTVRKERNHDDRRVEYRFLSGEEANYTGMAIAYRDYMEKKELLVSTLPEAESIPLQLSFIGGGMKPRFGGYTYEAATTFDQAGQIVDELMQLGISNMRVTYQGWQNSGRMYTDQRFPIASAIGGNDGAKRFVQNMHSKGVAVLFEDFMAWKQPDYSSFYLKSDGVRSIDSTVLQAFPLAGGRIISSAFRGANYFIVNPVKAVREQKQVIDRLKQIGVDGIHYVEGPGDLLYSDYNKDSPIARKDTAFYYESLLNYARSELGMVGVVRGNDYTLGQVDFIERLPMESSYDYRIDETVPFYPMVVHGAVEYTTAAGNLRNIYDVELLKAIEYGAVPYFRLTFSESRVLKETDYDSIYSSEFAVWKDRILDEYQKFNQLAAVYNKRMSGHRKLSEGVYETSYEDGTTVTVNYNTMQFNVARGGTR